MNDIENNLLDTSESETVTETVEVIETAIEAAAEIVDDDKEVIKDAELNSDMELIDDTEVLKTCDILSEEPVSKVSNPKGVIESILFAMGDSVEYSKLAEALGIDVKEVKEIVLQMIEEYNNDPNRGVSIVELDNSVQMCTKSEMYEYLIKVAKTPKNLSLTDTLLETLSIIAYKQPVTKAEIEKIRGVSCDHAVNKLMEYNLICELGRLNTPGRPLLFGTTEDFLRSFGVKSVDELPSINADRLEEFKKEAAEEVQLKLDI